MNHLFLIAAICFVKENSEGNSKLNIKVYLTSVEEGKKRAKYICWGSDVDFQLLILCSNYDDELWLAW